MKALLTYGVAFLMIMDVCASTPLSASSLMKDAQHVDTESYLKLNPYIANEVTKRHFNPERYVKLHFSTFGRSEGRPYLTQEDLKRLPEDFNPQAYMRTHTDVVEGARKRGSDLEAYAKYHYLKIGAAEGRSHRSSVSARGIENRLLSSEEERSQGK